MTDFSELISQAKKMQEKMKETQENLKKIEIEGISGANAVKVIMNGDGEMKKIIFNENILKLQVQLIADVFVARAFKPLNIILELIHKKAKNWKKVFIFLGKTGHRELLEASKSWDIKYKKRMSVTSNDSIILEINNLKKK